MDNKHIHIGIHKVIGKACEFIISKQKEQGYWQDFYIKGMGLSSQWVTSYIAYQLLKIPTYKENIKKAINWLLDTEHPNGGWGYHQNCIPDADSTLNAIRLLVHYIKYNRLNINTYELGNILTSYMDKKTGGFITYPCQTDNSNSYMYITSAWCKPEVSVTSLAGNVLFNIDHVYFKKSIFEIKKYLNNQQRKEGYWDAYWWDCRIYSTCMACDFFNQIGEEEIVNKAVSWLTAIYNGQLRGWGNGYEKEVYPFYTALSISTLLKCKHDYQNQIKNALLALIESQNEDGSWNCKPMLRIPDPKVSEPWLAPYRNQCEIATEKHLLFTTSTVVGALLQYLEMKPCK